jgi:integrase
MAKPQIWQRGQTGSYYATIGGKQTFLGRTEQEAKDRYDYLLGVAGIQSIGRVDDLLDAFLEWVKVNRSEATYAQYRELLQSFNRSLPATLRICDLKPYHISNWLDGQTWNSTTKNKAVGAVKRAFNWAVDQGHINLSPIARVKKPPVRNREIIITAKIWNRIGKAVKDRAFRDFLIILFTTGCRPYEARTVEARHVRKEGWLFAKVDSKGERYNRLVRLNKVDVGGVRPNRRDSPERADFR